MTIIMLINNRYGQDKSYMCHVLSSISRRKWFSEQWTVLFHVFVSNSSMARANGDPKTISTPVEYTRFNLTVDCEPEAMVKVLLPSTVWTHCKSCLLSPTGKVNIYIVSDNSEYIFKKQRTIKYNPKNTNTNNPIWLESRP